MLRVSARNRRGGRLEKRRRHLGNTGLVPPEGVVDTNAQCTSCKHAAGDVQIRVCVRQGTNEEMRDTAGTCARAQWVAAGNQLKSSTMEHERQQREKRAVLICPLMRYIRCRSNHPTIRPWRAWRPYINTWRIWKANVFRMIDTRGTSYIFSCFSFFFFLRHSLTFIVSRNPTKQNFETWGWHRQKH